jgi:NADH dehydrogenase
VRIVILGGGYAAIWCYRAIRRRLGNAADITIVAPFDEHVFHGFTGEVLDGELPPELQRSPLSECAPRARRIRGWATAVDPRRRLVTVEWNGSRHQVAYDQLVVATGARERTAGVPGLAEHGWPLRFPGMVQALLDHLAAVDAAPADAESAQRRRTIVVVGGGFAGTEVAAALGRRYGDSRRVVLVTASPTVVPTWSQKPWLQKRVLRNLAAAGVALLPSSRVTEVDEKGVRLANGVVIEAATVVSTLGNSVPALPGLEGYQGAGGLLKVDGFLRVTDGVWSAGDSAAVRSRSGVAPKDAIWAIRAGTTVGRNVARAARGRSPHRFTFRGLGTVAAFAPGQAVAKLYGVPLSGTVAWAIRAGFFLWYVPSRRTALRIIGSGMGDAMARSSALLRARFPVPAGAPPRVRPRTVPRPALFPLDGGLRAPRPVAGRASTERSRTAARG